MNPFKRYELKYYNLMLYKDIPVIVSIKAEYHTRVIVKGKDISVNTSDLSIPRDVYLMVPFYKGKEVKILKEKKFHLIIETDDLEREVSKRDINFYVCNVNMNNVTRYIQDYGICFIDYRNN